MGDKGRYHTGGGNGGTNSVIIKTRYILPGDSARTLENLQEKKKICEINLYLAQNKFLAEITEEKPEKKQVKKQVKKRNEPLLMEMLKEEAKAESAFFKSQGAKGGSGGNQKNTVLSMLLERNREMAGLFLSRGEYKLSFPGRLFLGEGGSSVYSNVVLFRLHPLYGVPYLPASTLKGILRNCWNALWQEQGNDVETEAGMEKILFGSAEDEGGNQGKLVFFDAFPEKFTLTPDVQNPHFPDYYGNGKEPTDDQRLRPIYYICLEKAVFWLHIACKDEEIWPKVKEKLTEAVTMMAEDYGVGAKTALGYGIGTAEIGPV